MESLPKRLSRLLKSQAGFSLAELMVAAGVTGTLALGTLQLASLQNKAMLADDLISAQQTADMIMKNGHSCRRTLRGINPVTVAKPFAIANGLSNSDDEDPVPVPTCQADGTNCSLRVSPGAADIANNLEDTVSKGENYVVFGNSVMVESIAITDFKALKAKATQNSSSQTRSQKNAADGVVHVENQGVVEMRFIFATKDSTRPAGQKLRKVTKYLYVPVAIDSTTGLITDCDQPADRGVQDTDFELCETLGGSYEDGQCKDGKSGLVKSLKAELCVAKIGGSFNAANGTCIPPWYSCSCSTAGAYVTGFTDNNEIICSSGTFVCSF
ncbi:MAG: hypothetical protein CME71_01045 [Halobacteriovorax sp.]|nr:hypothetical protein [Halobacteriovorax sp.]|tara:strand:+ start:165 stop:1145 length:981 start_codon:yes stop_codon:yes gene_type:complete